MIKIFLFCSILFLMFSGCNNTNQKQENNSITSALAVQTLVIKLSQTALGKDFDNIDFNALSPMPRVVYDSLQLNKVPAIEGYDTTYLSIGRILWEGDEGRIITIHITTGGELTEILISYDHDGNLIDSLIVGHEDMVEGYNEITSVIDSQQITVQSVDFTYTDIEDQPSEICDTTIARYRISPQLKFIMN